MNLCSQITGYDKMFVYVCLMWIRVAKKRPLPQEAYRVDQHRFNHPPQPAPQREGQISWHQELRAEPSSESEEESKAPMIQEMDFISLLRMDESPKPQLKSRVVSFWRLERPWSFKGGKTKDLWVLVIC